MLKFIIYLKKNEKYVHALKAKMLTITNILECTDKEEKKNFSWVKSQDIIFNLLLKKRMIISAKLCCQKDGRLTS